MRVIWQLLVLPFAAALVIRCGGTVDSKTDGSIEIVSTTPFSCGSTECKAGEYCESSSPGTSPPDGGGGGTYYNCMPIPAACSLDATCACIQPLAGNTCQHNPCGDDGKGHVSVDCPGE
jgi:hypothetical protein